MTDRHDLTTLTAQFLREYDAARFAGFPERDRLERCLVETADQLTAAIAARVDHVRGGTRGMRERINHGVE